MSSIDKSTLNETTIDTDMNDEKVMDTEVIEDNSNKVNATGSQDLMMSENKRTVEAIPAVTELRRSRRTKTRQGSAMAATRFAEQHEQIYGTQHYQAKFHKGFGMLKSKYVQAASFLVAKVIKHDEHIRVSDDIFKKVVGICFAQQMSANKGFKIFGERALAAMIK